MTSAPCVSARAPPALLQVAVHGLDRALGDSSIQLVGPAGPSATNLAFLRALLVAPTLRAQYEAVGAVHVLGNPDLLDRESQDVVVAAMTLPNILTRLVTEATVLMPSDRSDLLPGLILAHHSGSFPQITGVILTGGYPIPDPVVRLFDGMHLDLPIGMTELGTYTTAKQVFNTEGHFTSSPRKVEVSRRLFSERVDAQALLQALEVEPSKAITPLMFGYQLNELARRDRRRIVMPESSDDRILESASILMQRGVANELVLIDADHARAEGEAMDLNHGLPFVRPMRITAGDYADIADAEIIVITAPSAAARRHARCWRPSPHPTPRRCARCGCSKPKAAWPPVTTPVRCACWPRCASNGRPPPTRGQCC